METKYILNHFYKLRHDLKRSYILSPDHVNKEYANMIQTDWMSRIHPVLAMALSIFSTPLSLNELKNEFAHFFEMPTKEAEEFINIFLNNSQTFAIEYDGDSYYFPKNIIIDTKQQFTSPIQYTPMQFAYKELDFKRERPYLAPFTMVFMINNTCATDCIYCYANKSVRPVPLKFERLKEIVKEAHCLGVKKFTIVGGEVFLYKNWRELMKLLKENDLAETLISTKVPLEEDTVISLKELGLNAQISLDAIDPNRLQRILNVSTSYGQKIQNTVELLEKHHVYFQVSTVLTKYNDCITDLNAIHTFLRKFKYLQRWEIRVAFKSLYSRGDFDKIKLSHSEINEVDSWVKAIIKDSKVNILWSVDSGNKYFKGEKGSSSFHGPRCSANYSNLFVLPDGKVSICEQLYWNPRFIIGDVSKQSIEEVWSSPEALALAFPKRNNFRDQSTCKTCQIFDECMDFPNRCIADVLKGYGMENWDFPDPRCNKAPQFTHNLSSE